MTTTESPAQYTGYGPLDSESGKQLVLKKFSYPATPTVLLDDFVEIKVDCCGICGSDLHHMLQNWPRPETFPMVVGHEIVGVCTQAGPKSGHKVGDRLGVGAQAASCASCSVCDKSWENYCASKVSTYQGKWPDGTMSMGGYADYVRAQGRLAVKVPDALPSAEAAPLLCAGVTVYSPLKRFGAGPGKKVGVVGIGGLGHLALQIALAMGADTYAISHSDSKRGLVEKFGVKKENFIATKNAEQEIAQKYSRFFDIVIVTATGFAPPLESLYFPITAPQGAVVLCGIPEEKMNAMHGFNLVGKGLVLAGTFIGPPKEIAEVFDLAAQGKIKTMIEERPMSDAQQAVRDMEAGKAQFRYVLVN